jgi:hypothetical protein
MKTVLLFTGGFDSTYLAYKILTDTSDELSLYVMKAERFSPYNPDWAATPYMFNNISAVISELKKIRKFEVIEETVDVNQITFDIDNPNSYAVYKLIPKINDGTYDRIATGHSYDHCSMRYFKYLDMPGVGGDKMAKKLFENTAKRGSLWFPFITHDIHKNYGKYHAIKNLPENLKSKTISCLSATSTSSGPCGRCGKCEINNVTKNFMSKGYTSDDIQSWMEEKSLEYGGGNRNAPPPLWIRIANKGILNVFEYGLDNNNTKKYVKVNDAKSFAEWWDTVVYNYPIDLKIKKWNRTSEDWKKLIL